MSGTLLGSRVINRPWGEVNALGWARRCECSRAKPPESIPFGNVSVRPTDLSLSRARPSRATIAERGSRRKRGAGAPGQRTAARRLQRKVGRRFTGCAQVFNARHAPTACVRGHRSSRAARSCLDRPRPWQSRQSDRRRQSGATWHPGRRWSLARHRDNDHRRPS